MTDTSHEGAGQGAISSSDMELGRAAYEAAASLTGCSQPWEEANQAKWIAAAVAAVHRALSGAFAAPLADHEREELEQLRALVNSPELNDFAKGVVLEAVHQRLRWGNEHDAGKEPQDWFWLVGFLGGKALRAHIDGDLDKARHHTISSAAAFANWHGMMLGTHNMRPGIDGEAALAPAQGG